MGHFKVIDFEMSSVVSFGCDAVQPLTLIAENATQSMSRSALRAIRSRTEEVANGWSHQERVDRLRAGSVNRAWLLSRIEQM